MFGESSGFGRQNIDNWMPQFTTDVLFCADANLNDKTGACNTDSGGPAIQRLFIGSIRSSRNANLCMFDENLLSSYWNWDWNWDWNRAWEMGMGPVPGDDSIISWATTSTTPKLLTMKECSDNKVPLVNTRLKAPFWMLLPSLFSSCLCNMN